jgi:hypothetical protein
MKFRYILKVTNNACGKYIDPTGEYLSVLVQISVIS